MATEETLARRFKLRLSDGTVLAVDYQGLSVWLMDKKAMVQIAGSKEWRPLNEAIAEMRVAAKYAARERSKQEQKEKEEGKKRVGQKKREEGEMPRAAPKAAAPPTEDPTGGGDEPPGVADEPIGVADEPIGVADEPSAPGTPIADPAIGDHNPFGDAFIDEESQPPDEEMSRLVDSLDRPAADDAPIGAPLDIPAISQDPPPVAIAPPTAGEDVVIPPAPPEGERPVPVHEEPPPPSPPKPAVPPEAPVVPPKAPAVPPKAPAVPPEAPVVPPEAPVVPPEAPVVPPKPPAVPPKPPAVPPEPPSGAPISVSAPTRVRVVVPDPVMEAGARPVAAEAPTSVPPVASPRADEGTPPSAPSSARVRPVDRPPVTLRERPDREERSPRGGDESDDGRPGLGATVLATLGALGAFLSRFLQPISRLERGEPIVDESSPPLVGPSIERLRTTASGWAGGVRERVGQAVQRSRNEETPSRLASTLQSLSTTLSSWGASLGSRFRGVGGPSPDEGSATSPPSPPPPRTEVRESSISPVALRVEPLAGSIQPAGPEPPASPASQAPPPAPAVVESAEERPAAKWPSTPAPRPLTEPRPPAPAPSPPRVSRPPSQPRQTPPPRSDVVEVVPFVDRFERPAPEDLYEGGGAGSGVGELLRTTWAWAKVLVVLAILAGGAVFAVVNWRTWFPTAAELGEATFTEVDRVARSRERAEQQQRAVEELTVELPHLAPETIRLILSRSPTGVLEARDVFAIAGEATDRGFGTLTAEEATELDSLGAELHEGLGPLERERLRDYGLTRARRLVFVEEHGYGLALVARGARTMPLERRALLQALLAKAITAGLGPPPSR